MCLVVVAWKARDDLPLIVAANRDEWRDRPSEPAHWWNEIPEVLAGRDLKAGGTWMGVTRAGRFAAITNFRDPSERRTTARSRGELVIEFLAGTATPRSFLEDVAARASRYNGFNLFAGDGRELWYFSSREARARPVEPGVHGLSNHVLDEPWPKVVRGRAAMERALGDRDPAPRLFDLLSDPHGAPDEALPSTGVGLEWERRLAAPLIAGDDYGTRCSSVLAFLDRGGAAFEERTRDATGGVTGIVHFDFAFATSAASSSPLL